MKIGINQPNGITTLFGEDPSKFIDTKQPSNHPITQSKIGRINSTLTK